MRLVRLFALAVILATVYFAQYLYDTASLVDFFPAWLLTRLPALTRATRWLPGDLIGLAGWLTLLGLLGFGLLAPWWHGEQGRTYRQLPQPKRGWARWSAWLLLALAGLLGLALLVQGSALPTWARLSATWQVTLWLISLGCYAIAGLLANRARPPVVYADSYVETVQPWNSGGMLLLLLLLLGALNGFRLTELPPRLAPETAQIGLAARAWVMGQAGDFFTSGPGGRPLLTVGPVALLTWLTGDSLWAVRWAGLLVALALLAAVWAVGTELFRRLPFYATYGEVLEDDGRWIALLAVLALGLSLPFFVYARQPYWLDAVMLGTLGLWALLRGLRRDRPALLGLSALCLGGAMLYGPSGLLLMVAALFTWAGVWLLERSWLVGKQVARYQIEETVPVQRGVGWRGAVYWLIGCLLVLTPLMNHWGTTPGSFASHWQWTLPVPVVVTPIVVTDVGAALTPAADIAAATTSVTSSPATWWGRLESTFWGLNYLADGTGAVIVDNHFVSNLLAPILVLAVGALLLSIDSLTGWLLVAWLSSMSVGIGLTAPVLPAWPAYLVLLLPISLIVAFGLDRLRLLLMTTAGTWSLQATVYLALGLLALAGFFSWIDYYSAARLDTDLATAVGRAMRTADVRPVVMVDGNTALTALLDAPVVQLLARDMAQLAAVQPITPDEFAGLSPGTRVLLAPADWLLLNSLEAAHPFGRLTVQRDVRANPVLYIYDLIDTATVDDRDR